MNRLVNDFDIPICNQEGRAKEVLTSLTFHASPFVYSVYILCAIVCSVGTLYILLSAVCMANAAAIACPHSPSLFSLMKVTLFKVS